MSVYSGFATRQQETKYNSLLENLVFTLKKRIIKFYRQQSCDESKFKLLIKKIYKKMFVLEKGKFMAPKYSSSLVDLVSALNIEIDYDTISDTSSMMSQTFSLKRDFHNAEDDIFKSRAILETKRNNLQIQHRLNPINASFSVGKKLNGIQLDLNDQFDSKRSSSLGGQDNAMTIRMKPPIKLRELKSFKQSRGMMGMPKIEDFIPKKQQIEPVFCYTQKVLARQVKPFRRQKYSRNQVAVQQI